MMVDERCDAPAIGTAKGPGETPHEYLFVTPDPAHQIKIGEFVYYVVPADPERRPIYGRVANRQPVRLFPDEYMAEPSVSPQEIAALYGFDDEGADLFEISVRVLGYFDERLRSFVNPRIPPRIGWPIYLAGDTMLTQVLNKRQIGETGAIELGSLLSRPPGAVPIVLAAKDFTSTHLAILASTGAGKSYAAGVIVEELLKPTNRGCVLIVDPHAEYDTLQSIQGHSSFRSDDGYAPIVKIVRPKDIHVRFATLRFADLRYLLNDLSDRMDYLLSAAFKQVRDQAQRTAGTAEQWTAEDLIRAIQEQARSRKDQDETADFASTVNALTWRIERLSGESSIISPDRHLELAALFKPGQCTVLQLDEIDRREQQVVVAVLLRRLFQARQDTARGRAQRGQDNYLPYPAFVLLEEGHHFAPGGEGSGQVVSAQILRTILAEGRKFGVGIGLISQRPGKLDQDVLSQCMTQLIMRIVNPIDQNNVAAAVEGASRDVLDELPALSKGQAIVIGASVNAPVLLAVRERLSPHGGDDVDAPAAWVSYSNPARAAERQRDEAMLQVPESSDPLFMPEPPPRPRHELSFEELFPPRRESKP